MLEGEVIMLMKPWENQAGAEKVLRIVDERQLAEIPDETFPFRFYTHARETRACVRAGECDGPLPARTGH